jgi:hypothetical protein
MAAAHILLARRRLHTAPENIGILLAGKNNSNGKD